MTSALTVASFLAMAGSGALADDTTAQGKPVARPTKPQIDRHIERQIGPWCPWFTRFTQVNLVGNKSKFKPQILEPNLQNAWGIAIRPAGLGGHFWVAANTTKQSLEYVGDVGGVPLFQDNLKAVGTIGTPTGVVFNAGQQFVITQPHTAGPITAAAKFLFANRQRTDHCVDRAAAPRRGL